MYNLERRLKISPYYSKKDGIWLHKEANMAFKFSQLGEEDLYLAEGFIIDKPYINLLVSRPLDKLFKTIRYTLPFIENADIYLKPLISYGGDKFEKVTFIPGKVIVAYPHKYISLIKTFSEEPKISDGLNIIEIEDVGFLTRHKEILDSMIKKV